MKIYLFTLAIFFMALRPCLGQNWSKPPLDTSIFTRWPQAEGQGIVSPDGNTAVYRLATEGNNASKDHKVVLTSVSGTWKKILSTDRFRAEFTSTSSHAVVSMNGDSVAIIKILDGKEFHLKGVTQHQVLGSKIYYQLTGSPEKLMLLDLANQKKAELSNVSALFLRPSAKMILFLETVGEKQLLKAAGAKGVNPVPIWTGKKAEGFIYDGVSEGWAFRANEEQGQNYYLWDTKRRLTKLNTNALKKLHVDTSSLRLVSFYDYGDWIVLKQNSQSPQSKPLKVSTPLLHIWNFQGSNHTGKAGEEQEPIQESFAVNTSSGQACRVTSGNDERIVELKGKYALIDQLKGRGEDYESKWNKYAGSERFVLDLNTGRRKSLPGDNWTLAKSGSILLNIDLSRKCYQVVETATLRTLREIPIPNAIMRVNIFWSDEAKAVFYQDDYDVWKLNFGNNKAPVCVTQGYGRKNRIIFSVLADQGNMGLKRQMLYLTAQDEHTRANGFFLADLSGKRALQKLSMRDCRFYEPMISGKYWIWKRSTAERVPDFLVTKDFEDFRQIATPRPEAAFNWLHTELHHYPLIDGTCVQGILYKPDNFDSSKRYPLILSYYQRLQDWLHLYPEVSSSTGPMNIPWMVSRGYLVFVPDIINVSDRSMASATECILAANEYLKQLPYVDSTKIGITGHSFGGYTTLATVTRTNAFAAAFASAPVASAFTSFSNIPNAFWQLDITKLPWEDKEVYIDNSPVFAVNMVTTPVLIMGNRGDDLWPQPMDFFYGLRRLGKPVWMLEYTGQGHTISGPAEIDRTFRVQQFFDYYLKNQPCPVWMTTPGNSSMELTTKKPDQSILTPAAAEISKQLTTNNN